MFTRLSFYERPEYNREKKETFEMKLPIIASPEEQKKLKLGYENQLQKFKICDPLSIEPS